MAEGRKKRRKPEPAAKSVEVVAKGKRKNYELMRRRKLKAMRKQKIKRAITAFIILIFLLTGAGGAYLYSFISSLETDEILAATEPSSGESVNILLLGMDIGTVDSDDDSVRRTDTIMVVNYNPDTKAVNIVSIPRDTLIEVSEDYTINGVYQQYWKINAAYELGGEELVKEEVESLLDIEINYVADIDYEAFRNIIDAIGGIDMYIDVDMDYDDDEQDLHIHFTAGETVHLDGESAEEYFRWRKNNDGSGLATGDLGRISNQQKFISAVIEKCTSPSIVFALPEIFDAISENIVTNMSGSKMLYYALKMANNSGVSMYTLQGNETTVYSMSVLEIDESLNEDIYDALQNGTVADDSSEDEDTLRSDSSILILNGTSTYGLAATLQTELEELGYSNISVGNGDTTSESVIMCDDDELLSLIEDDTDIDESSSVDDDYSDYDAVIILGSDYS